MEQGRQEIQEGGQKTAKHTTNSMLYKVDWGKVGIPNAKLRIQLHALALICAPSEQSIVMGGWMVLRQVFALGTAAVTQSSAA